MPHRNTMSGLVALALTLATLPVLSLAEEKIEGKVVRTTLTACEAKPGGCEGTLALETTIQGKPSQVIFKVVKGTFIKKGGDYIFLPATQGSTVVITYVTEKGEKVARLIEVK